MVDAWATTDDVLDLTGEVVTDAIVLQAQDIIELFAGTTYLANDQISETNLRRLNRAVAYQAGWMPHHPDLFSHMDADSISQDGASLTPGHANASLLAPLAHRHIKRLTWMGKPWRVRGRYGTWNSDDGSRDSAVADDNRTWSPI